ncbi:MAG: hypothetical protein ABI685_10815 [Ferruginibacter sp.]
MTNFSELNKVRDILKQTDYRTLSNILDSYLPNIPASILEFENNQSELNQPENGGMNMLYRARMIDETRVPYQTVEEISYIPENKKHLIKFYGRVNKPGESMFYASTELGTACVETFSKGENYNVLKKKGSLMLVVGTWKIEKPLTLAHMASPEQYFSRFLEEAKSLNLKKITLKQVQEQNNHLKKMFEGNEGYEILNFFSEEFAKTDTIDHNEHKISNYYADIVFDRNPKTKMQGGSVDGIWYPSVPAGYQENNIVLRPEIVDKKLKFAWAELVWVTYSVETKQIQFTPLERRVHQNHKGILQWRAKKVS